jgi:hypothetical protein
MELSIDDKKYWKKAKQLLDSSRKRAKNYNMEHNLNIRDIPLVSHCPIFGMKLGYSNKSAQDNSPSIDRIDNTKGYVKGNVHIISWKANTFKSFATMNELQQIVDYFNDKEVNAVRIYLRRVFRCILKLL